MHCRGREDFEFPIRQVRPNYRFLVFARLIVILFPRIAASQHFRLTDFFRTHMFIDRNSVTAKPPGFTIAKPISMLKRGSC
jgi:hypothetical protein